MPHKVKFGISVEVLKTLQARSVSRYSQQNHAESTTELQILARWITLTKLLIADSWILPYTQNLFTNSITTFWKQALTILKVLDCFFKSDLSTKAAHFVDCLFPPTRTKMEVLKVPPLIWSTHNTFPQTEQNLFRILWPYENKKLLLPLRPSHWLRRLSSLIGFILKQISALKSSFATIP